MSFYKRINKYLLEHYPIFWNTNIIWMIPLALLFQLLFFAFGYAITNINVLKENNIDEYFFTSGVAYIYYIAALIILVVWLLRFFKHNPFKHFYPVKKTYFYFLFFQVLIILFLFASGNYSFTSGAYFKTKKILPQESIQKNQTILNLAYPFFITDISAYEISSRCYPAPFPLQILNKLENRTTGRRDIYMKGDPAPAVDVEVAAAAAADAAIVAADTTVAIHGPGLYEVDFSKPYITLGKDNYQFGTFKTINKDSCNHYTEIDSVYDVSGVYGLRRFSIFNYCGSFVSATGLSSDYKADIAPSVHRWLVDNDSHSIKKALENFQQVCKGYGVQYKYDAGVVADLAVRADLDEFKMGLVRDRIFYGEDVSYPTEYTANVVGGERNRSEDVETDRLLATAQNYYVYFSALDKIFGNYDRAVENRRFGDELWIVLFTVFVLTFLVVAGKFTGLANMLIAGVIAGVLSLLYFFLIFSVANYGNQENEVTWASLFYVLAIAIFSFFIIQLRWFNKWVRDKAIVILCVCLPILFLLINFTIHYTSYYSVRECDYTSTRYAYEITPLNCFIALLLALIPAYLFVRKWKAQPE